MKMMPTPSKSEVQMPSACACAFAFLGIFAFGVLSGVMLAAAMGRGSPDWGSGAPERHIEAGHEQFEAGHAQAPKGDVVDKNETMLCVANREDNIIHAMLAMMAACTTLTASTLQGEHEVRRDACELQTRLRILSVPTTASIPSCPADRRPAVYSSVPSLTQLSCDGTETTAANKPPKECQHSWGKADWIFSTTYQLTGNCEHKLGAKTNAAMLVNEAELHKLRPRHDPKCAAGWSSEGGGNLKLTSTPPA